MAAFPTLLCLWPALSRRLLPLLLRTRCYYNLPCCFKPPSPVCQAAANFRNCLREQFLSQLLLNRHPPSSGLQPTLLCGHDHIESVLVQHGAERSEQQVKVIAERPVRGSALQVQSAICYASPWHENKQEEKERTVGVEPVT